MRPDGCVMAARLLVCSLGTLELEGALLTLTTICLGLDGASSFTSRLATMGASLSGLGKPALY